MPIRRSLMARLLTDASGRIPVVIASDARYSDEQILAWLNEKAEGAQGVRLLAPGHISACVTQDLLDELETMARVMLKHKKEPHPVLF